MVQAAVYLGRPGVLVSLPLPRRGVLPGVERQGVARGTIGGGRSIDYAPGVLRTYTLEYEMLTPAEYDVLEGFFAGHNGTGPFAFIDPSRRNLLTANQSSATSAENSTTGFSLIASDETIASTSTTFDRGPRCLAWNLPAVVGSGTLTFGAPNDDWPGIPVVVGRDYRFQCVAKGGGLDSSFTLTALIRWLDASGANLSLSTGTGAAITSAAFTACSVAAPAPAGAAYALPRLAVTAATVAATATCYVDRPMFSMPADHDAGTVWAPGLGVPRVSLPSMPDALTSVVEHKTSLILAEVS